MEIDTYNSFMNSFIIINYIIFNSLNIIIDNIYSLQFDKIYYTINSIKNAFVLADFILKKLNKDDLNDNLISVFNNIVNLYNVALNTEIRLKTITTENVCKLHNTPVLIHLENLISKQ